MVHRPIGSRISHMTSQCDWSNDFSHFFKFYFLGTEKWECSKNVSWFHNISLRMLMKQWIAAERPQSSLGVEQRLLTVWPDVNTPLASLEQCTGENIFAFSDPISNWSVFPGIEIAKQWTITRDLTISCQDCQCPNNILSPWLTKNEMPRPSKRLRKIMFGDPEGLAFLREEQPFYWHSLA